ncbi:MAG TPA: hypothetical protein VGI40_02720 [Pirellulaceae bacterium]|jgi:plasmid stabilization system protein ParE
MASLPIRYRPAAIDELADAVGWYAKSDGRVANEFRLIVKRKLHEAAANLRRWPIEADGTRFILLGKYPYFLVVREIHATLELLAVAHTSREPGYWRDRLNE